MSANQRFTNSPALREYPRFRTLMISMRTFVFVAFGLIAAAAVAGAQQTFRTAVDLVHFGVVVTDKQGSPITGLTADDFDIKEAGKPQTIKFFSAGDPANAPPLHVGFLLDASGSMVERKASDARPPTRSSAPRSP